MRDSAHSRGKNCPTAMSGGVACELRRYSARLSQRPGSFDTPSTRKRGRLRARRGRCDIPIGMIAKLKTTLANGYAKTRGAQFLTAVVRLAILLVADIMTLTCAGADFMCHRIIIST